MTIAAPMSLFVASHLSTEAVRVAEIERLRVIHRVVQTELAAAALTTPRTYQRLVADPSCASAAVLARLEVTMRGLALARAVAPQPVPKPSTPRPDLLRGTFAALFLAACQHYALAPAAAAALLEGEERPAAPAWRRASHARQAAVYLVNQALAVAQKDLAQLIGKTPAAVCLALRAVEDRRDDDAAFDAFCESALALVGGAA